MSGGSSKIKYLTIGPNFSYSRLVWRRYGGWRREVEFDCLHSLRFGNKSRKRFRKVRLRRDLICICLRSTSNNLFVTVREPRFGKVLLWVSGGRVGLRGPRRATVSAAEVVGRRLVTYLVRNKFTKLALIYFSRPDDFRVRAVVNNIQFSENLSVFRYLFRIPVSHNGLRKKKFRRV